MMITCVSKVCITLNQYLFTIKYITIKYFVEPNQYYTIAQLLLNIDNSHEFVAQNPWNNFCVFFSLLGFKSVFSRGINSKVAKPNSSIQKRHWSPLTDVRAHKKDDLLTQKIVPRNGQSKRRSTFQMILSPKNQFSLLFWRFVIRFSFFYHFRIF